jgi:hypothetical protein
MYTLTLLKSFGFLMIVLLSQNILPLHFFNFGQNLDIIAIIMFYFCKETMSCTEQAIELFIYL